MWVGQGPWLALARWLATARRISSRWLVWPRHLTPTTSWLVGSPRGSATWGLNAVTKDKEAQSFHPPLPLNGPIFVEAHLCLTPIPALVVVKSVLRDIINLAASAPASRKHQRQEVDLKNVIDEPRARKVRKRES
ncbi:hypothetical protein C8J57DRAFT_1231152 [Mycena rebaudengoi]|nr:hypothetical protein C8J57DRAFT_1231152 [Mycena rebaudengoi]